MENILRENMRRFRTKNLLTEQTRLDGILQDLRNTDDDEQIIMIDRIQSALNQLEMQFYVAAKNLKASSAPEIGANANELLELLIGFFQPQYAKNSSAAGLDKFGLQQYGRMVKDLFRDDVDYENDFLRGGVNWYEFSNEAADMAIAGEFDRLLNMIKDKTNRVNDIIKPELRTPVKNLNEQDPKPSLPDYPKWDKDKQIEKDKHKAPDLNDDGLDENTESAIDNPTLKELHMGIYNIMLDAYADVRTKMYHLLRNHKDNFDPNLYRSKSIEISAKVEDMERSMVKFLSEKVKEMMK